ncbi:hypothetical protein Gogos_000967 [Gossypium gossypioides]|uniref:Uncharacterized protein n=1 Tax=Gossypium gossypioides TaxID=34282 RepID=A0A7J9CUR3_GOSGO|nr:hypothetical protein [Gossypium gossypioides]
MWERRYDFLPMRKPFLTPKLTTSLGYMDQFRHNNKSYLLSASKRSRQRLRRRPRQGPINPRSRDGDAVRLTFAPSTSKDSIVVQPPDQCGSFIFAFNPVFVSQPSEHAYSFMASSTSWPVDSVANTPSIIVLSRWVILATIDSTRGIHNGWLRLDCSQPWRKETKSAINPDVHVKVKPKLTSSRRIK